MTAAKTGGSTGRLAMVMVGLGLALAACAAPPVRRADVPEFGEVKAAFALGQDIQVINVRALDRLPITAAVLVLPGGDRVPAYSIDQQRDPSYSNQISLGTPMSDVAPIGGPVPMLAGPGMPAVTNKLVGQIASVGLIRVPDLAAYKDVWPQSKILVHMGFAPDDRVETLAAPQPG